MATYNGEQYVECQIFSILKQLGPNDQLILVDDKSTDNTVEVIKKFKDPRIHLSINLFNVGAALTFDRALHIAEGDLIFISDQDDRWHDSKVSTLVSIFLSDDIDLIVHDAVVVREGVVISASLFEMAGSGSGVLKNIVSNTFTGCCIAFRREILHEVLPISTHIGIFHDAWIGVLAQYFGYKIAFVPVPLMDFVRHGGNASTLHRRSIVPIILDRVAFVAALALQIGRVYFRRLLKKQSVIRWH